MGLFKSKKFLVALAGVIAVSVAHFTGLAEESIKEVLAIVVSYIIGQGIADSGKEAAKIANGK